MTDVAVPTDLWNDDAEAAISAWLYQDGESVQAGAIIAEIMVEKTTFELHAPAAGVLRIVVPAEASVLKGQLVGRVE